MIEIVARHGWSRNLRLSNGTAEVLVTLEVGPRILACTRHGGVNSLNLCTDQAGPSGELGWKNPDGHRLWLAPENREITYCPDNPPVSARYPPAEPTPNP
ncbi:MAG: hypothetical protein HZA93_09045 [Verrucomicrobia bacterium]|nr:hypothetical protein [Verrucomicrobiota bacterium]